MALLELRQVRASYGPSRVLHGIDLDVEEGQVVALLGANGAGKTTTLRCISGTVRRSGDVRLRGRALDGAGPDAVARLGVAHVPEGRGTLDQLTVLENLRLGALAGSDREGSKRGLETVFGYFPVLGQRRSQPAGTLSGGEQQMLAIGRALMARPRLMLLDEPSLGLAPLVTRSIFEIIRAVHRDDGVAVLLVEQNANLALELAANAYVLEAGRIVLSGRSADLRHDESVRRSYLGY
ncbi:MAG: ABC transporter ATP-binding protein [Candidatus Dormibacteraeota bacterium]|nr:ABC transporter ATP-binding protein [Candidatus Dormibacteraeota bacterium]